MKIWRGYHSKDLLEEIELAWIKNKLLIVCPAHMKSFEIPPVLHAWSPPEKPVLGVFTSGTVNGTPRLVLYSKSNIEASLKSIRSLFDSSRIQKIFCYPQPTHTFGLVLGYVHSLLYGIELVSLEGKYSRGFHDAWIKNISSNTLTLGAPAHFHDLVSIVRVSKTDPQASYANIMGGARVSTKLWREARDVLNIEQPSIGYGATEASPGVSHLPPGLEPKEDGEIGFPLPDVRVGLKSSIGLEFAGKNVCMGYFHEGSLFEPKKILLRDQVRRRLSDGVMIYEGRTELTLNRGGYKMSLELIEETLFTQLGLQAVCVPVPDERLGEDLGVLFSGSAVSREKIIKTLNENFGQNFNPKNCLEIDSLPLSPNAKIDRQAAGHILQREKS